jgi:uncharacterized protein DUF5658
LEGAAVFFRFAAAAIMITSLSGVPALASENGPSDPTTVASTDTVAPAPQPMPRLAVPPEMHATRPVLLPALYASFAALQGFDIYSTTSAIQKGATEANPLMQGIVGNPALFWSVKAAATVAPMLAAERLWKHNKAGAIAVMVVSNGVMAAVAAHNSSVLRGQR